MNHQATAQSPRSMGPRGIGEAACAWACKTGRPNLTPGVPRLPLPANRVFIWRRSMSRWSVLSSQQLCTFGKPRERVKVWTSCRNDCIRFGHCGFGREREAVDSDDRKMLLRLQGDLPCALTSIQSGFTTGAPPSEPQTNSAAVSSKLSACIILSVVTGFAFSCKANR